MSIKPGPSKRYRYDPLSGENCIRILELQPASDDNQPLRCGLREIHLVRDEDTYDALSYTWGDPVFSEELLVDDIAISITPNLSDALRRFRSGAKCVRRIWADAVCINQEDNDEKSTQIPLMSMIYRGATSVFVWLGKWPEEERLILQLKVLARRITVQNESHQDLADAASALAKVLSLPWFSRRWIIQEVVLNPDVHLHCGGAEISWVRLVTMIQNVLAPTTRQSALATSAKLPTSLMAMFDLWRNWAIGNPQPGRCGMLRLLDLFDHFGCKDGRDRIFALTGLAEDVTICKSLEEEDVWKSRLPIIANYSLSVEEVYTNLSIAACGTGKLLWLLARARGARGTGHKLPSWMPDLREPIPHKPLWDEFPDCQVDSIESVLDGTGLVIDVTLHTLRVKEKDASRDDRYYECFINRGSSEDCIIQDAAPFKITSKSSVFPAQGRITAEIAEWIRVAFAGIWERMRRIASPLAVANSIADHKTVLERFSRALLGGGMFCRNIGEEAREDLLRFSNAHKTPAESHSRDDDLDCPVSSSSSPSEAGSDLESSASSRSDSPPLASPRKRRRRRTSSSSSTSETDAFLDTLVEALADVLSRVIGDGLSSPRNDAGLEPFLDLIVPVMTGRCVLTCEVEPRPDFCEADVVIGIGAVEAEVGDRIISPYYSEGGGPLDGRRRHFIVREPGLTTKGFAPEEIQQLKNECEDQEDDDFQAGQVLPFQLVGDCFLANAREKYEGKLWEPKSWVYQGSYEGKQVKMWQWLNRDDLAENFRLIFV